MRVVDEHVEGFEERNFFLELVVGLSAAARRVERIVARVTPDDARSAASAEEHPFDLFALGAISFSRGVLRHLADAEVAVVVKPVEDAVETRGRDLLL